MMGSGVESIILMTLRTLAMIIKTKFYTVVTFHC